MCPFGAFFPQQDFSNLGLAYQSTLSIQTSWRRATGHWKNVKRSTVCGERKATVCSQRGRRAREPGLT